MMTIELVTNARGREWWVMIAGTCVVSLDNLSPKATPTEVRMYAEQKISEMIRSAQICGGEP